MFATVSLTYMMDLATNVWIDEPLSKKCRKLRDEIEAGIQRHGIVEHEKYGKIYAYEVDGLGKSLLIDDANVPSLLSIPYLGYKYDEQGRCGCGLRTAKQFTDRRMSKPATSSICKYLEFYPVEERPVLPCGPLQRNGVLGDWLPPYLPHS